MACRAALVRSPQIPTYPPLWRNTVLGDRVTLTPAASGLHRGRLSLEMTEMSELGVPNTQMLDVLSMRSAVDGTPPTVSLTSIQ